MADGNLDTYSQYRREQRFALATLYFATGGESWQDNEHWMNHSVHECDYELVYNIPAAFDDDIDPYFKDIRHEKGTCPGNSPAVTNLVLANNNLNGTLPPEFFRFLPKLTYLDLTENSLLYGSLPTELGRLSELNILFLDDCNLNGTLPSEIGGLSIANTFSIWGGQLSGTIPSELGKLRWLEHLLLGANNLEGTIPDELVMLTNLIWLALENNHLTGTIPIEVFGGMDMLAGLELNGNSFSGSVPSELGEIAEGLDTFAI